MSVQMTLFNKAETDHWISLYQFYFTTLQLNMCHSEYIQVDNGSLNTYMQPAEVPRHYMINPDKFTCYKSAWGIVSARDAW